MLDLRLRCVAIPTYLRFIDEGDEKALVRHSLIGRPEVCREPRLDVRLTILIHTLCLLVRLLESHAQHMALTKLSCIGQGLYA